MKRVLEVTVDTASAVAKTAILLGAFWAVFKLLDWLL